MKTLAHFRRMMSIIFLYAAKLIYPDSKKRIDGASYKQITTKNM